MIFKKYKKGMSTAGFSIIVGIIIILFSGGVIIAAIKESAGKFDEKLQVDLCRISNEVRYFYKQQTNDAVDVLTPTPARICSTIDKTTIKTQVPRRGYSQDVDGASEEIRDMIKNCWYMWLEGSENNMFEKMPFGKGCFVCYAFEVKDGIEDDDNPLDFIKIQDDMDQPYFATDRSDKCSPLGGFIEEECKEAEGWSPVPSIDAAAQDKLCCVKEGGFTNECENKGGMCSGEDSIPDYDPFGKWSCDEGSCFVKHDDFYSYSNYVTKSPRGGDVYFLKDIKAAASNLDYAKNYGVKNKFAISFISPARQFCAGGEGPDGACIAGMAGFAIAGTAAIVLAPFVAPGIAAASGSAIATTIGAAGIQGTVLAGTSLYGAHKVGILEKINRGILNLALKPITKEAPSFIIVSSLSQANQIGCLVNK